MVKMRWRRDDEPPDTPATIPITLANIVLILTELGNKMLSSYLIFAGGKK